MTQVDRLSIDPPILQAPMASGLDSELAFVVSRTGGLGALRDALARGVAR